MAAGDRVGNVYLDVLPKGDQFNAGVQALINKAERDAKFNVNANTGQAQQAVKQLGDQINKEVGGGWVEAASQAAAFTGAVFAARAAIEGVINKFSQLFDVISKARAGFDSLLGEKSGEGLLQEVRQFAIDSPFVTSELVQYSQQLLGVGKAASTIVPTLKNVGDIVASVGGDTSNLGSILYALTQIQTIGKLTGQDARQLQNQLVPITKYIAEYTGKSVADVKKLQEAGGIASDVVFKAIESQGKKVEGALNNSVHTIQGAKSVLSDTLSNFVQSNPGFNKIYDDLVKGIQNFSAWISKPEIKKQIDDFLDSIGKLYEKLKPLAEGIGKLGASGGLSTLGIFTRTLETLSSILNAFPESVLRLIGTALASMAALRAPLALIQYANNISRIGQGILGGGLLGGLRSTSAGMVAVGAAAGTASTNVQRFTDAQYQMALATKENFAAMSALPAEFVIVAQEANAAANAIGNVGLAQQKAGKGRGLATIGAAVAGGLLQSNTAPTNVAAQTAGGALTYGALGYQVGGPYGAAAGVAFGAITSFLDANDKRLEAQIEKNRELGRKAAEAYLTENKKLFDSATGTALQKAHDDVAALQKTRAEAASKNYDGSSNVATDIFSFGQYGTSDDDEKKKALAAIDAQIAAQKEAADSLTQPVIDAVKAAQAAGVGANFLTGVPGIGDLKVVKNFNDLEVAVRQYGVSLSEVTAMGKDAFVDLVTKIDSLDTVQKRVVVSANEMAEAIKNADADSKAIYDSQIKNLQGQASAVAAVETAKKAAVAAIIPSGTTAEQAAAQSTAQITLEQAESAVRTQAVGNSIVATEAKILAAKKAGNTEAVKQLTMDKDVIARREGEAAINRLLTDVTTAQTDAINDNTFARTKARIESDRAKVGTDIAAQIATASALKEAQQSLGAALTTNNPTQIAVANKALFDAQEAAANEAAEKATAKDRQLLADKLASSEAIDAVEIKNLQRRIDLESVTAKQAARQDTLNKVTEVGVAIEQANNIALEQANIQRQKAVALTELQNRSNVLSSTQGAVTANISAIRRPDELIGQTAAALATAQALTAAGDEAAFRATEKLVAQKQDLIDHNYTENDIDVINLNTQISLLAANARRIAEAKELAQIEKESAVARQNYDLNTIQFLERLTKAQILTNAIFGDEIGKSQALSQFASAIDSASSAAAGLSATLTGTKTSTDDIFTSIGGAGQLAAVQVAAVTAKQEAMNIALAYGATQATALAAGMSAYNATLEASLINVSNIAAAVTKINPLLSAGEGQSAISAEITKDAAATQAALAEANRKYDDLVGRAQLTGQQSPDLTKQIAAAAADKLKYQHILDIIAGKAPDDLGIMSSISAGAQAAIQPSLDAAAKQKADAAAAKLQQWQDAIVNATNALTDKLKSAADAITAAALKWTTSIKERTQYEQAVSVGRLTKNANQQGKDITEITSGLANLRSRGVSDAVLTALGIDSTTDTRQIRKLVKSSDADLGALSAAVSNRNALATTLATSEEQKQQHDVIMQAILDAAKTLGVEANFSRADATALSNSVDINVNMDPAAIAAAFIAQLSGAKIG